MVELVVEYAGWLALFARSAMADANTGEAWWGYGRLRFQGSLVQSE